MGERMLRGSRLGAVSYESDRNTELAPRQTREYLCVKGHQFEVPFAVDAEVPTTWECKFDGSVARLVDGSEPEQKKAKPPRTHWDMLLERRSIAELPRHSPAVAVLVALVAGGLVKAAIMLGIVIAVQQVEAHVLQPFLLGRAVEVHPLAVIVAIAAGVLLAGIVGALFAVPFVAVVNVVGSYLSGKEDEDRDAASGTDPPLTSGEQAGPLADDERGTSGHPAAPPVTST